MLPHSRTAAAMPRKPAVILRRSDPPQQTYTQIHTLHRDTVHQIYYNILRISTNAANTPSLMTVVNKETPTALPW